MTGKLLAESYSRLGNVSKSARVAACGEYLEFKRLENGTLKLSAAHFCQVRLCPLCSWRRELRIFSQLSKVVDMVDKDKYRFLFLTLTCQNVDGPSLAARLDNLFLAFRNLTGRKVFNASVRGFFRVLEVTHDTKPLITAKMLEERKKYYSAKGLRFGDKNPNFDTYHPHFHVLLLVDKSYFDDSYISQPEWASLWQSSLGADYLPVVDVRALKGENGKGLKEVAKYSVKETDYIVKPNKPLTDSTVFCLDNALRKRRLVAYGGILKGIHKSLNLQEDVTADVHADLDDGVQVFTPHMLEVYEWHVGFKNYALYKKVSPQREDGQ